MDLLNDLDKLPKQTISINAEGNKGETRSINIPVQYKVGGYLKAQESMQHRQVKMLGVVAFPKIRDIFTQQFQGQYWHNIH